MPSETLSRDGVVSNGRAVVRWREVPETRVMSPLESAILGLYFLTLVILSVLGGHRYIMVWLYYRHRDRRARPVPPPSVLPPVTVQLPIYNEMYVLERLLDSVCAIRYPKELLEIQLLDDSTDETRVIARQAVERYRSAMEQWQAPTWRARSCVLYRSRLDPAGAVHTPIQTWALGPAPMPAEARR